MQYRTQRWTGAVVAMLLFAFCLSSCKKRRAFNEEDGQYLVDVGDFRTENELVVSDANAAISDQFLVRGKGAELEGIQTATVCGMTMDTTSVYTGSITLRYTGVTCGNRKREGVVLLSIQKYPAAKWKQKGTVLKIEYIAYKVTNTVSGKSIQFDGIEYITNESGGTWYDIKYLNQPSLVHSVSATDLKLRYGKDAVSIVSMSKRYTYSYAGNVMTCKIEGSGTQGDKGNLDCWGQTRDGAVFTSQLVTPVVWKSSCTNGLFVSGEVKLVVDGKYYDLNCVYGTDADGNVESGNVCAYGWKMVWSYKNKTQNRVFVYY